MQGDKHRRFTAHAVAHKNRLRHLMLLDRFNQIRGHLRIRHGRSIRRVTVIAHVNSDDLDVSNSERIAREMVLQRLVYFNLRPIAERFRQRPPIGAKTKQAMSECREHAFINGRSAACVYVRNDQASLGISCARRWLVDILHERHRLARSKPFD